ncbi:MAG: chalcone isomerase family protein [Bdellovibrionales bacterium]|nr:chalcone isomerase family protein [Bdellovibrionales bacterium]
MKILLIILTLFLLSCSSAKKDEAIQAPLPNDIQLDGKKLMMQGQGFRIGRKFGFTAKVYKVGIYTDKKYDSASELLNSPSVKHLYMRFTYTITKGQLVEGWEKAYKYSCIKQCKETRVYLNQFIEASTGMKIGDIMEITFKKEGVLLNIHKSGQVFIKSPDFSYNLLAIFIGPKVLDESFKKDLMSL